jgi:small subunit ribosomal protein S20
VANIKSQIKRNRQTIVIHERNKAVRSELRSRIKVAITAADEGSENADELVRAAQSRIDRAVLRGILHKNTAAHRKARLAKHLAASKA